jgi:hypothetical protein
MSTLAVNQSHEIVEKDLRLTDTGPMYDDEAAAAIAVRDFHTCSTFVMQQQWAARWIDADTLVQSPQSMSPWGQGIGPRASVPNFLLSNTLDAIVPKIVGGLTYEDPPFLLRPRPGTTDATIRSKTAVLSYQLEDMQFGCFIEESIYDMGLRGTMFAKWGWHEETRTYRKFKRKSDPEVLTSPVGFKTIVHTEDSDAIEFELVDHEVRRPYIEKKDLARVFPDPACKSCDVRKAKWVVEWNYVDWSDLEILAELPDYTIPSKDILLDWFFRDKKTAKGDNPVMSMPEGMRAYLVHAAPQNYPTSADPLRASLGIIERQDGNSIITVLMHGSDCILIRNSSNPFAHVARMAGSTGHTYLSSVWRPLRDSAYGQGLGQIVGTRQMVAQGTENLALEVAAYPLHPTFTRVMGWNTPTQQISLGTGDVLAVEGDDVRKGIGLLEMPKVPPEVWQILQYNKSESLESAGANQQTTMGAGAAGIQTTGMRSGSGAQLVGQAAASRLDGPVERFIRQVFEPFLYICDNLNNELLPTRDIRKILADQGEDAKDFDHVQYRNAQMKYEVLAGAHLGPKREMIQFLSVIEQIAINPALLQAAAEADMTFNFVDWFKSFAELSGFKFSQEFFVEMTAAQKKRRDMNSAAGIAAQKNQAAQQQFDKQQAAKTQQIFDSGLARAGEKVTVLNAEHALQLGIGGEPLGTETPG